MKISLIKIVNASNILKTLTEKRYRNWSTALRLASAKKELNEKKEFYMEQERKLIAEYVLKDEKGKLQFNENGQPKFASVDDATAFQKELILLQKTEVEVFDPIRVSINDFAQNEESLSPDEILTLNDFIIFYSEKEM